MMIQHNNAESNNQNSNNKKSSDIIFSVDSLARSYGQTKALRSCTFSVSRGEVHALIGENGAGKSTLVKIISGILSPDAGRLSVDNVEYKNFPSPSAAREIGIGTAFQEILIVPEISILHNIWLGAGPSLVKALPESQRRKRAKEIFEELTGSEVPLEMPAGQLAISQQQLCVIARGLLLNPKIAILDEPTAALDIADRDRLFRVIRRMACTGTAFIFISHRLDEIMDIADNITVLRTGESITTLPKENITPKDLICLMSGDIKCEGDKEVINTRKIGDVRLHISELQVMKGAPSFSMELHSGEIIGVAGLEGHGQDQFITALAGINKPLSGTITMKTDKGQQPVKSLKEAAKLGIAYVPRSRKTAGIFESLSIMDNFSLPALTRYTTGPFLRFSKMYEDFNKYKKSLSFHMGHFKSAISTLSGGNQQKVLVARWLNMNPNTIIFNDPTRGVDPRTKEDLYRTINILASSGVAVIFLSTDVEELVAVVDKVLVFRNGTMIEEIPRKSLCNNAVVSAFFGHRDTAQDG